MALQLIERGFSNVVLVKGGWGAWQSANLPIEAGGGMASDQADGTSTPVPPGASDNP